MMTTPIIINTDFITLGCFLKYSKIITNGGQAKTFLSTNEVLINGKIENRRGKKMRSGDLVIVQNKQYIIQAKGY
ncbi:MAG: S4 domain-containing protein YaaA [Mycoplasmataceae bacterium]|jgi:S4 domain protein YaaA|nr:S4 domain-containing protein YaaA [Mycoplasmataceae bacterium]